jgi:hypothetical protein
MNGGTALGWKRPKPEITLLGGVINTPPNKREKGLLFDHKRKDPDRPDRLAFPYYCPVVEPRIWDALPCQFSFDTMFTFPVLEIVR